MQKRTGLILNLILVWFFLSLGLPDARGGNVMFDLEDLKSFTKGKPIPAHLGVRKYKEVKLIAGDDNLWFSEDDVIYDYHIFEYDSAGKTVRVKCYKIGPDQIGFNDDDQQQRYEIFVYDANDRLIREISHDSAGDDNQWFTADDTEDYQYVNDYDLFGEKTRAIGYSHASDKERCITFEYSFGMLSKDVEYRNRGKDNKWCTLDDRVDKYHIFEYDPEGKLVRTLEYSNPGKDKIWFTRDDPVNAYKACTFGKDGLQEKTIKYIGAGADKKWFTADDEIQYYILYYYS